MAWLKLTPDLLRTHLADSEISALDMTAVESNDILAQECHLVAAAWRGRLKKIAIIDRREDYVPIELLTFILVHVRQRSYTRLPAMEPLLTKLRQDEIRRADEIFDNPSLVEIEDPEEPEEDDSGPMIEVPPRNFYLDCNG